MSSRQLGPLFIDLMGESLTGEESRLLRSPVVGGVILFSRNYSSPEQLRSLVTSIRKCRPELLISVDHEGGRVQRFRRGFTLIPSMQQLSQHPSLIEEAGWLLASELAAFNLDFSFTPVLDTDNHYCAAIGDRSFSSDPEKVLQYAGKFIRGLHAAGMPAIGKHFPGHGGVKGDSHLELPVDGRSMDELEKSDLIPFYHLRSLLDGIMPAHICFPKIDDRFPVGFSKTWLHSILRQRWQYQGVIFSDDLSMKGAEKEGGYSVRVQRALHAGCDAVLICNNRGGVEAAISFLESQTVMPTSSRLTNMRRTKKIAYDDLIASARWKAIRGKLEQDFTCC